MRISLLYPKWTGDYGRFSHFADKSSSWPPLNLAELAAIAELKGHEVRIIDGQVEGITLEEMAIQTLEFKPDVIGMTATTPFFHINEKLAQRLKELLPEIPVVIGGHHITVMKEKSFNEYFDYAFIGEAETSWSRFLDNFELGKDICQVKGLLYRMNGNVLYTGAPEKLSQIDSLPIPARHLLPMHRYEIGTLQGTKKFTTIMTTRGCPFKCTFCSTNVFGQHLRKRAPELVLEEIKDIIGQYGIKHFVFLDDTMTLDKKHFSDICDLIIKNNLDITFEGSTRANLIDEEIIVRMKKAGLIRLSFGLESVDENIRRLMKKEVPLAAYSEANRLTNKYDIETLNSCMIGLPGETVETVCKTLSFLRKSREIKQANISIAVPYPGTELYEMARKREHGLELVVDDYSKFRRYNTAVMKVGDLTPDDLVVLQNDAFVSIYIMPWRWKSMFKRTGIWGVLLTLSRLKKCILSGRINILNNRPRKTGCKING